MINKDENYSGISFFFVPLSQDDLSDWGVSKLNMFRLCKLFLILFYGASRKGYLNTHG